jgi:hypothetical protein
MRPSIRGDRIAVRGTRVAIGGDGVRIRGYRRGGQQGATGGQAPAAS